MCVGGGGFQYRSDEFVKKHIKTFIHHCDFCKDFLSLNPVNHVKERHFSSKNNGK